MWLGPKPSRLVQTCVSKLYPGDAFVWPNHYHIKIIVSILVGKERSTLTILNSQGEIFKVTHHNEHVVFRLSRRG
jgi:hypothetical protein